MKRLALALLSWLWLWLPALAHAAPTSYGDWIVGQADDASYAYAATSSASGDVLGKFCYPRENVCRWILAMNVRCRTGSTEVALFNSRQGAVSHELSCGGAYRDGKQVLYRYLIHDPRDIDSIVSANRGKLGIAYPLRDGMFQADHFSMRGALPAVSAALNDALRARHAESPPPQPAGGAANTF